MEINLTKLEEAIKAFRPDYSIPVIDTLPQVIAIQSMEIDDYKEILRAVKAWAVLMNEMKVPAVDSERYLFYKMFNDYAGDAYTKALSQYNGKGGE